MKNKPFYSLILLAAVFPFSFAAAQSQTPAKDSSTSYSPRDFSGVWAAKRGVAPAAGASAGTAAGGGATSAAPVAGGGSAANQNSHPPFTPWAQALHDTVGKPTDDPTLRCDPDGFPKIENSPEPFEIVMAANRMFMFFEKDHISREIWLDGRALPTDPDPTWNGTSVGHWEGNTLVVETVGARQNWLDYQGDQHSGDMHLTERFTRTDADTLKLDITVVDPKAYTAPWVFRPRMFAMHRDWEINEWYCAPDQYNPDNPVGYSTPSSQPANQ
jgi:hypothetical protein